jgi:hypothetical protein
MKHLVLIVAITAFGNMAQSQTIDYSLATHWYDKPEKHKINPAFDSSTAVGILDERNIDYRVEGKEITLYTTYHRIVRINEDKGIEMFNKIYVPLAPNSIISELKARTILSNGQVHDLPESKIKEIEEDGRKYKLFAMEGLEKGAEVEYTYTIKKGTTFFGMEVFQTSSIPYQEILFSLAVPKHLKFDAKGFNGFKVTPDSLIGEKRIIIGAGENVRELDEEKYAEKQSHLKRVEYKLSYNLSSSPDVRLYTWKEFAKRAYANYTTISPKDEKPLASFIAKMKVPDNASDEAKVIAIENYIKTNISVDKELIGEDVASVERIAKNKSTDVNGILRLFTAIFEKTGINYQIVFTGRRDEFPLDEELENWNRIDETVFFFPETGKYLSPSSVDLRYPYIPAYWTGTQGLFLKGMVIGSFKTAVGAFKEVAMEPYEKHSHNMEVTVKFNEELDTLLINSKQILTGYGATQFRPIYAFLPKDKQEAANLEIIKSVAQSNDIKNIKVENELLSDFVDNKPYSISADIKSTELLEAAGNKILLKIGEIIGPQVEMYQEKPRRLPVELPYPHVLDRKITLQIPEGYQVKNLNDLNFTIEHKDGNESTMGFVSKYVQSGNIVTIDINESYKKIHYPLSQFEDFKKVINASADFNKVVLVLEKK